MDWREAARRYRAWRQQSEESQTALAAEALRGFLASPEGAAAIELLAASGRHIRLAEENQGDGYGVVFYLDGTGLHRSDEAMGTWIAYADRVPEPHVSPATPEEAAEAALASHGSAVPDARCGDLVGWLRDELGAIAAQAP